jgi:hypothetical protein
MIRFIRGSPFLSTLFAVSFLCGLLAIPARGDLVSHPETKFRWPSVRAFFPANFLVWIICVFTLFSVRHLEHVIGTAKCLAISVLAYFADWLCRTLLGGLLPSTTSSGPYAIITALLCLYCVFLPTVRSHLFAINEKVLLVVLLLMSGLFDSLENWILIVVGFIVFLLFAPLCLTDERQKRD